MQGPQNADRALRVAIVRPRFTVAKGGAERYIVQLAQQLMARGHTVHVFASEWDRDAERMLPIHPVPRIPKPAWLRVLSFHLNLRRRLRAADFDIVLGMTLFAPQVLYWLGDGLYTVWVRAAWPRRAVRWVNCIRRLVLPVNIWLERRAIRSARYFLCNSNLVRDQLVSEYGIPNDRMTVTYQGVDPSRFHPGVRAEWRASMRRELGLPPSTLTLLFASNNFRRKGLHYLFRALRQLLREGMEVRLVVLGRGRIGRYRLLASLHGIASRVTFLRHVEDVERYYAAADLFVLPTKYDPLAVVCLEAMACGLPVITSSMNGAAELIDPGRSGDIVRRPADARRLAEAIKRAAPEPVRERMGRRAAETASRYPLERHIAEVIEGMEAAVRSGREVRALHVIDAGDGMMVNERFAPVLAEHELLDFAALVRGERAEPMDYNRTKRLYRYRVGVNGHAMTLYMKQQRTQGSALAMTRWLRNADAGSPTQEWENLLAMQRAGLPTADPVAAGHRQLSDGSRESFVMTLGLHDYRPLDDVCRERFAARLDAATLRYKRALIRAAADLTRRLHASGFNHRDYYLCHMFVREGDGPPTLRLIDLQRCGWWWHVPYRYRVKDLAALHYSSLATPLTDRDRVRFFLWYAGERRRDPRWRQLIVDVLRKSRTIARHDSRRWAASTV